MLVRTLRSSMLALVVAACGDSTEHPDLSALDARTFTTADGSATTLNAVRGEQATLFLTLDPECPMTLGYVPLFDSMQQVLPAGLLMVGFYPAPFIVADSVRRFAEAHDLRFTQLMDADCRLANALHAHVTPEAFLVDAEGTVIYRGAIDDSAVREGRTRTASKHYLMDALSAFGKVIPQPVKEVAALGCIVECDGSAQP